MKPRPPIPEGPYLVVGLARSGIAAALALRARGEQVDRGRSRRAARCAGACGAGRRAAPGSRRPRAARRVRAVVKSPGVPAQAPVIAAARARGLTVLGELELAWRLLANEFIAVTGTNGKTTTVELIGHIHREAGLPVAVAGNVGVAAQRARRTGRSRRDVVCETSSFQLEDTLAFAPEAAVLLNITPDHLDRHGTLEDYREAKLRIFAHQGAGDLAVLGSGVHDAPTAAGVRRVQCGVGATAVAMPAAEDAATGVAAGSAAAECALYDGHLWWQGQPLLAADELRLRGRAQRPERDGRGGGLPRARDRPGRRARRSAQLRGRRPPPGGGRAPGRRALRQRLQGDQRRQHARGPGGVHPRSGPPDPRRSGQGPGLRRAA